MKIPASCLFVVLCLFSANLLALPASKSNQGRIVLKEDQLYGSWVSTDLSGDAIWLVVDNVGVKLNKDKTFDATANMSGGSAKKINGTYEVGIGKIRFKTNSMGDIICYYTLENGQLTVKPDGHDITAKFKKGELSSSSGGGAPVGPGFHF